MSKPTKSKVLGSKTAFKTPVSLSNLTTSIGNAALSVNSKQTRLNVKFIDLSLVKFDKTNPRDLHLLPSDIERGPKLKNGSTLENFEKQVQLYCNENELDKTISDAYMNIAKLAASIGSSSNLINPITVQIDPKGSCYFYLIAGHRRALAHLLLGEERIAACVLDGINELEKSVLQWKENQDRDTLALSEQVHNIIKIKKRWEASSPEPFSNNSLITLLKFTKAPASRMLNIVRNYQVGGKFQTAIDNNLLTSEVSADIIARLEPKQKEEILCEILNGKTFTRSVLQAMLNKTNRKAPIKLIRSRIKSPIKAKQDVLIYGKLIKLLLTLPELENLSGEIEDIDLKNKEGSQKAWQKIINFIKNQ